LGAKDFSGECLTFGFFILFGLCIEWLFLKIGPADVDSIG